MVCTWLSNYFFVEDEYAQLQTAEDVVKILMKGDFLKDNLGNSRKKTEKQKLKAVFKIIRSNDLAAGK